MAQGDVKSRIRAERFARAAGQLFPSILRTTQYGYVALQYQRKMVAKKGTSASRHRHWDVSHRMIRSPPKHPWPPVPLKYNTWVAEQKWLDMSKSYFVAESHLQNYWRLTYELMDVRTVTDRSKRMEEQLATLEHARTALEAARTLLRDIYESTTVLLAEKSYYSIFQFCHHLQDCSMLEVLQQLRYEEELRKPTASLLSVMPVED